MDLPVHQTTVNLYAIASVASGGLVFMIQMLPPLGLLGVVPVAFGAVAVMKLKKTNEAGLYYAYAGIALGLVAVCFTIFALAIGLGLLTLHFFGS